MYLVGSNAALLAVAQQGEVVMKPLPKWVGFASAIGAVLTAVTAAVQSGDWNGALPAIIAAGTTILALFSHSATGTGGVDSGK